MTTVRCAMEPSPFVKELQERIARIRDHAAACPELSGFELAFDRGNITAEEFAAAKEEIDRCERSIKEETARVELLAAEHPAEYEHFLAGSAAQLQRVLDFLNQTASTTFEQRFTRSLIPDLIEGLEACRRRQPARHSLPWLLRVTADTLRTYGEASLSSESAS